MPGDLWASCFGPPHEGLFWFRAIEAGTAPGQFRFSYGVLRRDAEAIGIVPAFLFDVPLALVLPPALARVVLPIARGPLRGLAHQRTFFIGNVAGEEGRVGLRPGHELRDVAAFIHREARARADELGAPMLVWKDVPDASLDALEAVMSVTRAFPMPSFPGTRIELVAGGYRSFLDTQNAKRRRRIVAKLRDGEKVLALRPEVLAAPTPGEHQEMFALFEQTRSRATQSFETLTPAFFASIALEPEARFLVLRDDGGRIRAFMLLLDLGERIVNQFIGLDYAAGGAYLHFRLFAAAYDHASLTKARLLDSGQTGYTAKLDLGHRLVPLWNLAEHRGPLVNGIFRRVATGINWDTLDPQLDEYLKAHPDALPAKRARKLQDKLGG